MFIDKDIINETEVEVADGLFETVWDCVADTDNNWWLANQMYLKGVHDMADALRKKVEQ